MGVIWLLGTGAITAILYWIVVVGEGAYLGPWAVRLIYRLGAAHYDRVRSATHANDPQLLLPILRESLAGVAHPQVLDVATGTGRVPLLLADEPDFAGTIIGLDLTRQMLDQARQKQAIRCPQAPIRWQYGEAGRLDWPNASFDLVCCLEAIEYFPHPRRALSEMARVLRPGSALVISKWPDVWAYTLPGRALTRAALTRHLTCLGFGTIIVHPWQPGNYELVTAKKC
jgi:ubiquinone/menaquinone biosynthesis C-methylase UbiE